MKLHELFGVRQVDCWRPTHQVGPMENELDS
jgi:hypothetical protein